MPKRKRDEEDEEEEKASESGSESGSESDGSEEGSEKSVAKKVVDGVFEKEYGTLTREVKSFDGPKSICLDRGYGKTGKLHDHPFLCPQILIISGPTGSGKTTLLMNILEEIFDNIDEAKVGKVLFYTGSPRDQLLEQLDEDDVQLFGPEQTGAFVDELRELQSDTMGFGCASAAEMQSKQVRSSGEKGRKRKLNVVIMDDVANNRDLSPVNAKGTDVGHFLMSHRHIPSIVIMITQKFNMLPTFARANAQHIFLFPGHSEKENKALFATFPLPQEGLIKAMRMVALKHHNFLWIDLKRLVAKEGFSKVLLE